jgi:hypothetical protein
MGTEINCALICEEDLWAGCGIQEVSISARHASWCGFMSTSNSSCVNIRQYSFKLTSSFVWACTVDCCMPSSSDCYGTDFWGKQQTEAETAAYVVKHIFLQLPCGQSLTLPRVNTNFCLPSNVAFHGGALLNRSENTVMTWATVWPGCGLSHTHTLAIDSSSTE